MGDLCPGCSGPVPYEAAGPTTFLFEDGHEEFGIFNPGDAAFCRYCWQTVDEQGHGTGYPVPGRGRRWTPPTEPGTSPPISILIHTGEEDRSDERPTQEEGG